MIGLVICLSIGMVPLTLLLVKQELIKRAGETVALGATDIADKLDIILAERLGDIQAFAQSPVLTGDNHARMLAYLEDLHRIYPIYRRLSIVDHDGHLIASTDATAQDGSTVSPAMLQAALGQAGPHVELIRQPDRRGVLWTLSAFRLDCRDLSLVPRVWLSLKSTSTRFVGSLRKRRNTNTVPH